MILLNLLLVPSVVNVNHSLLYKTNELSKLLNPPKLFRVSQNEQYHRIGIVDFRYVLKKSKAMKILGNKFILIEKQINKKIKKKQEYLKNKELKIKETKSSLSEIDYKKQINIFKTEVFNVQKKFKEERSILNKSFQRIQNEIKDLLAKVIKDLSIKKNINVVILKENVFLYNNPKIDLTNEVLEIFNNKTKSMKVIISSPN